MTVSRTYCESPRDLPFYSKLHNWASTSVAVGDSYYTAGYKVYWSWPLHYKKRECLFFDQISYNIFGWLKFWSRIELNYRSSYYFLVMNIKWQTRFMCKITNSIFKERERERAREKERESIDMYFPNPSITRRTGVKVNFQAECCRFEFKVFLLQAWLSN